MSKPQPSLSLVDQMKISTSKQHRLAERTGVIGSILSKNITIEKYTLYLRNLYDVYLTLERPLRNRSAASGHVGSFLNTTVSRGPAIEIDLDLIYGSKKWRSLPILPSSKAYCSNISNLQNNNPIALLGHIYVRYLGDMNGGQILERLLKQALNLNGDPYNFYRYPAINDLPTFRAGYREMFNIDALSLADKGGIIDSAIQAFECNIALSNEIMSFEHHRD